MLEYLASLLWIIVLVIAIIFEVRASKAVAVWYMPAAAVALLLSFFRTDDPVNDLLVQIIAFTVISLVVFLFLQITFGKKLRGRKANRTNLTDMIGERCLVTEEISNINETGTVHFKGLSWSARSLDEKEVIEEGAVVKIDKIQGVKLVCSRDV